MAFATVKENKSRGLYITVSKKDFRGGDTVEIVRSGSMLQTKSMEKWIRRIVRAELNGDKTPLYTVEDDEAGVRDDEPLSEVTPSPQVDEDDV